MKTAAIWFCVFWLCQLQAQEPRDVVLYLDSLERPVAAGEHEIVRVLKNFHGSTRHCTVYDYYRTGTRKLSGTFSDKWAFLKTGAFTTYYDNGKMQSQISYRNDEPQGKCYFWWENGNKKAECTFVKLSKDEAPVLQIHNYWSRIAIQRVTDGAGHFQDEDMTSSSEGALENGFKQGLWKGEDYKDAFVFEEFYRKGRLLNGVATDSLGRCFAYKSVFTPAAPRKGAKHFTKYLNKALDKLRKTPTNDMLTLIWISLYLDAQGEVTNLQILNRDIPEAEQELLHIIQTYGSWQPAYARGIATDCELKFSLLVK